MMLDVYDDYVPGHATAQYIADMAAKGIELCLLDNGYGWACVHRTPCPIHSKVARVDALQGVPNEETNS